MTEPMAPKPFVDLFACDYVAGPVRRNFGDRRHYLQFWERHPSTIENLEAMEPVTETKNLMVHEGKRLRAVLSNGPLRSFHEVVVCWSDALMGSAKEWRILHLVPKRAKRKSEISNVPPKSKRIRPRGRIVAISEKWLATEHSIHAAVHFYG